MGRAVGVFLLIIILVVGCYYWLKPQETPHYRLIVLNNTALMINRVSVFGSGARHSAEHKQLKPGQSAELNAVLEPTGQLRFEVIRGYNRIDAIFEDDVSVLERDQLWLIINKNNRFVLAESAPQ